MRSKETVLGVDIGTTKIAACLVRLDGRTEAVSSIAHEADVTSPPDYSEQDARLILKKTRDAISRLPREKLSAVRAVGVTGQMHGVVLTDVDGQPMTPLVTWQDKRSLSNGYLDEIVAETGHNLRAGFGSVTLGWLSANNRIPDNAKWAATIQDCFVRQICDLSRPVTDTTDAASWGLFNLDELNWDFDAIATTGIPAEFLPEVLLCGSKAGQVCASSARELGIPKDIPVAAAMGDNQASLLATLNDYDDEIGLTLGTGGQVAVVLPPGQELKPLSLQSKYEYRPFVNDRMLIVGSCLAGGSAWAWLASTVEIWCASLGLSPLARDEIFQRLSDLGLAAGEKLRIRPHFAGERHDSSLTASIEGIRFDNFDLGQVSRALAIGIMENLKDMLPQDIFTSRSRVVGSGNALRRTPLLQKMAEQVFGMPLRICDLQEEAAYGAAMHALSLIRG